MHRFAAATVLVVALTLVGCSSGTEPRVPAVVEVSPSVRTSQTLGETVQFTAVVRDADGNTLTGRTLQWGSTDTDVATVDADGLATTTGSGETMIEASVDGVSGSAVLTVELEAAELEQVAGNGQTAPALSTLPVDPTVRVLDSQGGPIPGMTVTFAVVTGGGVVSPVSATTDANGEAATEWTLGLDEGTQTLRASAGSRDTEFNVTATEPRLTVATLVLPDARSTVGYDLDLLAVGGTPPYSWEVVDGSPPSGLAVSNGGTVSGTAGSEGSASFTIRVTDLVGDTASRAMSLRVCGPPLVLSSGDVFVANPSGPSNCAPFLPSGSNGDRYRVGVVRTTLSDGLDPGESGFLAEASVQVTELGGSGVLTQRRTPLQRAQPPRAGWAGPDQERARATAEFHRRMLLEGERLQRELGREAVAPDTPSRGGDHARLLALLEDPPDRIELKPYGGGCTSGGTAVPALLVAFNDHVAVYQDSVQQASDPLQVDDVETMLDYFDAYGASTVSEYFGDVTDINGDMRVTVFASPVVASNVAAFVWPGDFLQTSGTSSCAASNVRELIYFNADIIAGVAEDDFQALPVLAHEMKHVSSLYRRLVSQFHPVWIEEGSAEIAAEISSRKAMEAVGDVAQGARLTRDAFPTSNIADPENYGVLIRLVRMINSYSAPVNSLTDNPEGDPDHTFYGTSWHFHRFLGDAYGDAASKADGVLFLQLNDSLTAAGTAGISDVTGKSTIALMEEYAAAMMLNGTGAPEPALGFTTYDFPTATDILRPEFQPPGAYPWPHTGPNAADFESATYTGDLAPGGLRVHEFESDGGGEGIEIRVTLDTGAAARVVIVRID